MIIRKTILALLLCLLVPAAASAHTLWVNLYKSAAHKPGHVIASLGWGHMVPMDDILENFDLATYTLIDPALSRTELPLPAPPQQLKSSGGKQEYGITDGDMGTYKMILPKNALKGTYQVTAVSKENYYSTYLDSKGRKKWIHGPMDKAGDKKVLEGMKFTAYAKSFFTNGKWTAPKPVGFDLEILPRTDLSNVRAGDLVQFDIRIMGAPLNSLPEKKLEYMTLTSNTFGGPDGFTLAALIQDGKASFRMPTAGQWVANIYTRQEVTPDGPLKSFVGKCTTALYAATVSFTVKP